MGRDFTSDTRAAAVESQGMMQICAARKAHATREQRSLPAYGGRFEFTLRKYMIEFSALFISERYHI